MVTVTGETGPAGDECAGARQEVQLQCDANAMRALAGLPGCCAPAQEGAGRDDRAPTPRPLATACINTSDHAQVRRGEYRDRDRRTAFAAAGASSAESSPSSAASFSSGHAAGYSVVRLYLLRISVSIEELMAALQSRLRGDALAVLEYYG